MDDREDRRRIAKRLMGMDDLPDDAVDRVLLAPEPLRSTVADGERIRLLLFQPPTERK